jgi:hypothetical protein
LGLGRVAGFSKNFMCEAMPSSLNDCTPEVGESYSLARAARRASGCPKFNNRAVFVH